MTDACEIIARQVRWGEVDRVSVEVADNVISALTTSGFRILGPDEIDGPTVEKFKAEGQRLLPHYQSATATDAGRRQIIEYFDAFADRALKEKRS